MKTSLFFTLSIYLLLTSKSKGEKILILTVPIYSHCNEVSSVGQALVEKGHQVFIVVGSTFDHKNCYNRMANGTKRIVPIHLTDSPHVMTSREIASAITNAVKEGKEFSILNSVNFLTESSRSVCTNIVYDKEGLRRLQAEKFDLVIVDTVSFLCCMFVLPMKLGVPYIGVSSHFESFISGQPFLPSIIPHVLTKYTDSMSFFQRLANGLSAFGIKFLSIYATPIDTLQDFAPGLSRLDVINLASKCELYLHNYDVTLAYPVPVMPNHVLIGGITAGPAKPLPTPFKEFYKKSIKGVVLVTFGSHLRGFSQNRIALLTRVFKRLDADVLWKHDQEGEFENIKQVKWLPQNDILANSKTKVFVSHCGNNGVFEALYHGVPLVCTPIFGDQFLQGLRVAKWKAGVLLSLLTASEEELFAAINTVLTDPVYRSNMKRASEMYHSQPMCARERAVFWVEYVLKFGGGHLRSRASEMSTFTYMGYDLVCFVVGVLVILVVLIFKCMCLCYRRCLKRSTKLKTN